MVGYPADPRPCAHSSKRADNARRVHSTKSVAASISSVQQMTASASPDLSICSRLRSVA